MPESVTFNYAVDGGIRAPALSSDLPISPDQAFLDPAIGEVMARIRKARTAVRRVMLQDKLRR